MQGRPGAGGNNSKAVYIGVGAAVGVVVLIVILMVAFSGGGPPPKPQAPVPTYQPPTTKERDLHPPGDLFPNVAPSN
jgi:hypothetical protein